MSNETYLQSILTRQGRKALRGDVSGRTDAEVRKKGRGRVVRRTGTAALLTTVALGVGAYGLARQGQVNANQVKADKAEAAKILSNPGPGLSVSEGALTASVPVAQESTGEAAAPAASSEGAWTPTPGTESVGTSTEPAQAGQTSETGGMPAEPASPEAGGLSSK
jgi:hypothetical protein